MKTILSPRHLQRLTLSLLLLCLPFNGYAQSALNGDVNGDGNVNITDVNAIISIILDGKTTTPAADVNSDGTVNITDINAIINVILGGTDNHEYVDLGLPSGTLWATCNVGASRPEKYGGYYAWGETKEKEVYSYENYLYRNIDIGQDICGTQYDVAQVKWGGAWRMPSREELNELWNYCSHEWTSENGVYGMRLTAENGKSIFLPAAGYNRNSDIGSFGFYRSGNGPSTHDPLMPSYPYYLQFASYGLDDLGDCPAFYGLSVRPVINHSVIDVEPKQIDFGVVVSGTDKTSSLTVTNTSDSTVSITVNCDPSFTDYFEVSSNNETRTLAPGESLNYTVTAHGSQTGCHAVTNLLVSSGGGKHRLVALSARGVDSEPLLDVSSLSLNPGEKKEVVARSGNCTMTNSNQSVAHVWKSGGGSGGGGREEPPYLSSATSSESRFTVEALSKGTATVVITDEYSGQKGILTVTVRDGGTDNNKWVDLGLPSGTLWATCNVGASTPEEYGDYFAWGETEPKDYYDWNSYKWCNGSNMTLTKYCTDSSYGYNGFFDNKTELDLEDDAAYVNWGSSWRMPTLDQQIELIDNCTWTWTTQNGVNGHLFTGPNGKTLFLPAAGQRSGSSLINAGTLGCCWSRTLNSSDTDCAHSLFFNSGRMDWGSSSRIYGIPVRAVRVSQN